MLIKLQGRQLRSKSSLRFQIEMKDALGVDELDAAEDLSEEVPAFGLGQLVVLGRDALEELAPLEILGQQHALLLALKELCIFRTALIKCK